MKTFTIKKDGDVFKVIADKNIGITVYKNGSFFKCHLCVRTPKNVKVVAEMSKCHVSDVEKEKERLIKYFDETWHKIFSTKTPKSTRYEYLTTTGNGMKFTPEQGQKFCPFG